MYYLHEEGPNLGKHHVPRLLLPLALDTQFGTPYLISVGFDTDSSAASSSPKRTIKPCGDDTVELSMKAPMSVSKRADLV